MPPWYWSGVFTSSATCGSVFSTFSRKRLPGLTSVTAILRGGGSTAHAMLSAARSSLTCSRAATAPPPLWLNGSTTERRTLGSSVTDFSASGLPSTSSVKSKVCGLGRVVHERDEGLVVERARVALAHRQIGDADVLAAPPDADPAHARVARSRRRGQREGAVGEDVDLRARIGADQRPRCAHRLGQTGAAGRAARADADGRQRPVAVARRAPRSPSAARPPRSP